MFEAWRQPDHRGHEQLWFTLRSPAGGGFVCHPVDLVARVLDVSFEGPQDGTVSVLCGAISREVEAVLVTPPGQSTQRAPILQAEGLGRFFFMAFDWPIERVGIDVDPKDLEPRPFPFAVNLRAEQRRMETEGVVIAEGESPGGRRWRLRVWEQEPGSVHVRMEEPGLEGRRWVGGGYGGGHRDPDRLVKLSMSGGDPFGEGHIVGELARSVAGVRVRLEDGCAVDAQILRTDDFDDDYWVAFAPRGQLAVAVVALDERGEAIAEEARTAEASKHPRRARAAGRITPTPR